MSTTTVISHICRIAEDFGHSHGMTDFEIERVVHSRTGEKDEWIVQLSFTNLDPLLEDDKHCAIVVVDTATEEPRLLEGL